MSNPFLPWLPMYRPGAWRERPWWRLAGRGWTRVDGAETELPDDAFTEDEGRRALAATVLAHLDAYDTERPLPAPPPMVGQVWSERTPQGIAEWAVHAVLGGKALVIFDDSGPDIVPHWPPPGAVLVAGPTPWGRDVPWAPPGWEVPRG